MAIFSDGDESSRPTSGSGTKGWDSIGSLADRRKENTVEAKPWAGEKLKGGKTNSGVQKMMVFKDEVSPFLSLANRCSMFTNAGLSHARVSSHRRHPYQSTFNDRCRVVIMYSNVSQTPRPVGWSVFMSILRLCTPRPATCLWNTASRS